MTDFYQDQNVVVLGGAGFVGQHLCRALEARGADVRVIDNLSRHESQLAQVAEAGRFHRIKIWHDSPIFTNVLSHINPFAVFNLAASVAGVEYNQSHHNQMFLDNVQPQTIPVMVCERLGVPHFLQVSSACVYGEDANAPAVEYTLGGEPVGANAGYSWAKRMGERVVQWSNLQHAVIVRPANVYGPGDWYDERAHVIPKLIRGYAKAKSDVKMFGDGSQIREFIYVDDAAEGMIHALEFGEHKAAYNLGTGGKTLCSMRELHTMIANICGSVRVAAPGASPTFDKGDNARFSDCQKMAELGWVANTNFRGGLTVTIEAYLGTK